MIGFKSFASRTVIDFRPGIIALVGPNGCGKSNIVDSIRWVLGEQRTSVLRADRMESVIFNGTQHRRPLGMAEVTLTIENNRDILPSSFSEVAITRRLYRSGESEYAINRTPSRLRDINEMFQDTGFGRGTYSIIELPMVEGIISGPSESRRKLVEEAAGVAKFKSRRASSERRLASTRESLVRLEDVYGEIEKRFRTLKRQASRAQNYQSLERALELRILIDLSEERVEIISNRDPLEIRLKEINTELEKTESHTESSTTRLNANEGNELIIVDRLNRANDTQKRLERRDTEMNGEIALAQQRISYLQKDKSDIIERREDLQRRIKNAESSHINAQADVKGLESTVSEFDNRIATLELKFEEAKANYTANQKITNTARLNLNAAQSKLSNLRDEIRRREAENIRRKKKTSQTVQERETLTVSLDKIKQSSKSITMENAASVTKVLYLRKLLISESKELELLREEHASALSTKAQASAKVDAARGALNSHRARASASFALPKALKKVAKEKNLISLGERIQSNPEHRAAIAAGLRPVLDALDIEDLAGVFQVSEKFDKRENAIMRFPGSNGSSKCVNGLNVEIPEEFSGCQFISSLILNQDELGDFLRNRLCDVVLVSDRENQRDMSGWASENKLRLITPDGECLDPDGVFHAGQLDPDAMQIGWSSRLTELEKNLKSVQNLAEEAKIQVQTNSSALSKSEESFKNHRNQLRKQEDKSAETERMIARFNAEIERKAARLNELVSELNRYQKETLDAFDSNQYNEKTEVLELAVTEAESKHKEAVGALQQIEYSRIQAAEKRAQVSAEKSQRLERLNNGRKAVERFERMSQQLEADIAAQQAKMANNDIELDRVRKAVVNIEGQQVLTRKEKVKSAESIAKLNSEKVALRKERDEMKDSLRNLNLRQRELLEARSTIEGHVIGLRERLREVDRRLEEEAHVSPITVHKETVDNALKELEPLGYVNLSAEKIRTRISSIGPVNMLALEELKAVEERYLFLRDQKLDLENGIEVLEETIDRINTEARRRFRETFDQININFQRLFRRLFEGGEARIQLEGEDPLEADIIILATPTMKKLQSLSMLSGGEKALTAIALLFAIYQVRPSPFCILDEVDAPLDDANIGRFNRLVKEFSDNTQYLVITHNKRTMTAADNLIGVTLNEDGSSHIVSVKLERTDENTKDE